MEITKVIDRLSNALQKLMKSASAQFGGDCLSHAGLAKAILDEMGVSTRLVVGASAWRVGSGDGDVISHLPQLGGHVPLGMQGMAYHAWLEMDTKYIDFSTYSLRFKAAELDKMDGQTTKVDWCPNYLVLDQSEVTTFEGVARAVNAGVAFYEEIPGLYEAMCKKGFVSEVAQADVAMLRMIMANPDVNVYGPMNHPT